MNQKERDIQRKLRILKHAEEIGSAVKTCRYFSVGQHSCQKYWFLVHAHCSIDRARFCRELF